MSKKLAQHIVQLRKKSGFSQECASEVLGMSRPTYIEIEKGERDLTISEAEKLAAFFDMSLERFLAGGKPDEYVVEMGEKKKEKVSEERDSVPRERVGKFKEVLLYILEKVGAKPNIGETAIYKLLYFIDFDYYEKYEEQLIGARYIKNHYGPTPVAFKKIIEDMEKKGEIEKVRSSYFKYKQKKYLPKRSPNLKVLSAQELALIDYVLNRLSDKNAVDFSNYSHGDLPWKAHEMGEVLDYESVFYRDDKYSVREYVDEL
ncbi:MAG: type II toxin-antitoxin system antitoxin SocA domain-containing protein [Candidatus Magasanikbacteria bacterium]